MQEQYASIFPERVIYGTFWQRFAASFLDGLIILVPNMLIGHLFGKENNIFTQFMKHEGITSLAVYSYLVQLGVNWIYSALMESSKSQATLGKQALGIKVTDLAGNRISFGRASGRYFGKMVSTLILFMGYFMILWDDKNQALHDKMAETLVVKKLPTI